MSAQIGLTSMYISIGCCSLHSFIQSMCINWDKKVVVRKMNKNGEIEEVLASTIKQEIEPKIHDGPSQKDEAPMGINA